MKCDVCGKASQHRSEDPHGREAVRLRKRLREERSAGAPHEDAHGRERVHLWHLRGTVHSVRDVKNSHETSHR